MPSLILKLALSAASLSCQFPNVCETIRISDDLVIESQYMPEGSVLTDEYMLIRVEDFSVVQAEVEHSAEACNLRLNSLKKLHLDDLKASQARCEERAAVHLQELMSSKKKIEELSSSLEEEKYYRTLHTWLNAVFIVSSATLATYIMIQN